jgi:hypothetical protein
MDSTWMKDTWNLAASSSLSSPGSARPEVAFMISPVRKLMGLESPARTCSTAWGWPASTRSITAASWPRSVSCSQPRSRTMAPGSLSSAKTTSSTCLAILPWMRRSAIRRSSSAKRAAESGQEARARPPRFKIFCTSEASHRAAACGSAPSATAASNQSATAFSSIRKSAWLSFTA